MQHAKENTKQIFDINTKTAKTLEQNTKAIQDSASRFNTSFTNNQGNTANTSGTTSTTTTSTTSADLIYKKYNLLLLFTK